jgi:endonuclease YncB( thermonuclease family)
MKILIFLLVTTLTISNVLASKEVKYDPKKDIWTSCTVTKVKDGDTLICGKYTVRIA